MFSTYERSRCMIFLACLWSFDKCPRSWCVLLQNVISQSYNPSHKAKWVRCQTLTCGLWNKMGMRTSLFDQRINHPAMYWCVTRDVSQQSTRYQVKWGAQYSVRLMSILLLVWCNKTRQLQVPEQQVSFFYGMCNPSDIRYPSFSLQAPTRFYKWSGAHHSVQSRCWTWRYLTSFSDAAEPCGISIDVLNPLSASNLVWWFIKNYKRYVYLLIKTS